MMLYVVNFCVGGFLVFGNKVRPLMTEKLWIKVRHKELTKKQISKIASGEYLLKGEGTLKQYNMNLVNMKQSLGYYSCNGWRRWSILCRIQHEKLSSQYVGGCSTSLSTLIRSSNTMQHQYQYRHRQYSTSSIERESQQPCPAILPMQFLKSYEDRHFDPTTHQRNIQFDPIDGKVPPPASSYAHNHYVIDNKHHHHQVLTTKSNGWIDSQTERWRADANDFDSTWTQSLEAKDEKQNGKDATNIKRILWSNWTENIVRDPITSPILFHYDNLAGQKNLQEYNRLLKMLYQYGLVLITGTPSYTESLPYDDMSDATKKVHAANKCPSDDNSTNESADSAILHLASIIGYHPLQTLYGSGVWSTSSQSSFYNTNNNKVKDEIANDKSVVVDSTIASASTADSAYGSTSLPLHTDMTYLSSPPGVQVFLMVQPATTAIDRGASSSNIENNAVTPKGQSVYLDGFAAAKQLLIENPEAYRILASTPRTYRCIDDNEGWHLEATGPVIDTVSSGINEWGPVKAIRHNDLDRLPDLPPYPACRVEEKYDYHNDIFYKSLIDAHNVWDDILSRDCMRLVINLKPGDCMLVANNRCMHGRYAFETTKFPRVVMGCYVGIDELESKWRNAGLRVI